jgi:hypothetical protein
LTPFSRTGGAAKATLIKFTAGTPPCVDLDMKQQTLAMAVDQNSAYEEYRRPTKRDVFLATMDRIVRGSELCSVIEPFFRKAGNVRPPVGLERMLRMYFVQHWFNLTDAAREDELLDSMALRRFVGIDLGRERVPDATTLLKFRELLAEHGGVQDDPLGVPLGEFVRERMHRRHIHLECGRACWAHRRPGFSVRALAACPQAQGAPITHVQFGPVLRWHSPLTQPMERQRRPGWRSPAPRTLQRRCRIPPVTRSPEPSPAI